MIKKNITINFCGRLYNIDEDAYELLKHYTDTIRRYFSKMEGSEEVADDIESRIAELFDEQKARGVHAIDINMTRNVIDQIGNLEDIITPETEDNTRHNTADGEHKSTFSETINSVADNVSSSAQNAWKTMKSGKRYYRDAHNQILAGVLAGMAQYFGGSILIWRLVFLFLVLVPIPILDWIGIGGILVIGYIVLAIIAPKAENPEEVLQMQGKDVTPQNLAEEVSRQQQTRSSSTAGDVFGLFAKLLFVFIGVIVLLPFIAILCAMAVFLTEPLTWFTEWFHWENAHEVYEAVKIPLWIAGGAFIAGLSVLAYCSVHAIASSFGKTPSMGIKQRFFCLIAFIICLMLTIAFGFKVMTIGRPIEKEWRMELKNKLDKEWNVAHMHDGFVYSDEDWHYFNNHGWRIKKAEHCNPMRYTLSGEHFTGDTEERYFDTSKNSDEQIVYHAERTELGVDPGTYSLSCVCRSSKGSSGVFMFVAVEKDGKELSKKFYQFLADGNEGNRIYKDSLFAIPSIGTKYDLEEIVNANDGKGYGWGYITIKDIDVPADATLRYGITADPEFTGVPCTADWFSAYGFELVKNEKQ